MTRELLRGAGPLLISMRIKTAIIGVLLACLLAPAAAGAASSDEILRDCADGQIDGNYSRKEIDRARKSIPGDLDEYSDCRGALEGARIDITAGKGKGGTGSGGGGGTGSSTPSPDGSTGSNAGNAESADPQNPAETAAVKAASQPKGGGAALGLGAGPAIKPGATGIAKESDLRRSIPDSLLVVLILLGTVALVGAVLAARARVFTSRLG